MSNWDRRQWLWSLAGASATPFLWACGARPTRPTTVIRRSDLLGRLRELADTLEASYPRASVTARIDDFATCGAGEEDSALNRWRRSEVRLRAGDSGREFEIITDDLSEAGLASARALLREQLGTGGARRVGARERAMAREPRKRLAVVGDDQLRAPVQRLSRALTALKSSRLIRRSAHLDVLERQMIVFGGGIERSLTSQHSRVRAVVVAWTGTTPARGAVELGTSAGLFGPTISADDLQQLEAWALTPLTARTLPAAETNVVLSPRASAVFIGACVVPCLDGARWSSGMSALANAKEPVAAPSLELVDDPALDGFGFREIDDDGRAAVKATILAGGRVAAPFGAEGPALGRRQRRSLESPWQGTPTNLLVRAGELGQEELYAGLDSAVVVDGPLSADVDPATLTCSLRACRGRGVRDGALSGRLYGDVVIEGRVDDLLRSVKRMSRDVASVPFGMGRDWPSPWQVSAPAMLLRARIGSS